MCVDLDLQYLDLNGWLMTPPKFAFAVCVIVVVTTMNRINK
jgi:hypothetical protein